MSKSAIGNIKECRKHALACLRLAQTSPSPHVREHFANLAKTWLKLVGDLQALRDTLEEPESRRRTHTPGTVVSPPGPLWVKSGLPSRRHSMSALLLKADIQATGQHVR